MQTIKISIEKAGNGYEFTTGYKAIGVVHQDAKGAFVARFQGYKSVNMLRTLPDAVEFLSDAICSHFEAFGLDVEFVSA